MDWDQNIRVNENNKLEITAISMFLKISKSSKYMKTIAIEEKTAGIRFILIPALPNGKIMVNIFPKMQNVG